MSEKNILEKIKKWEEDLKKFKEKKEELEKKIESLNEKISSAKKEMEAEKNKKIAAAVEEIFGPLDEKDLEALKSELMIFSEGQGKNRSEDLQSGQENDDYFELDGEENESE